MEGFLEVPMESAAMRLGIDDRKCIRMAFPPRCIGDLGNNAVERASIGFKAVIKGNGIKDMSRIAKMRKHADRAVWRIADALRNPPLDRFGERQVARAQVIISI